MKRRQLAEQGQCFISSWFSEAKSRLATTNTTENLTWCSVSQDVPDSDNSESEVEVKDEDPQDDVEKSLL